MSMKDLNYYMGLPYMIKCSRISEEDGGGYEACFPEFGRGAPVGMGDTPKEAVECLNENKEAIFLGWIEAGFSIPEPPSR